MALIKIYNATDTDFISNNGIKALQPTKCNIHNEINGEYYADIECNISFAEWMKTDNIIVINGQGFRLSNPKVVNSKMTFKAYHLSYDSKNYVIQDIQVDNYTVQSIANLLNTHIYPTQSLFSITSDITNTLDSCKFVYQSLYDCLMALVEVSGGFLVRDNWNIGIKKSITIDNQKTIALGKNIKTYQSVENWDNVVTTLIPIAQDGSMLENKMLVSDIRYDIPYTKTVTFSSRDGVDSNNPTEILQDLQEQATKYLEEHCIPDVCYTIDSTIGEVVVGETIQLKHNKINQNLITSVYATDYNVLTGKIDKITFGTFYNSASQAFKTKVTDKFISMYRDLQVVDETNKSRFSVLSDAITAEVIRSTEAEGELSAQVQLTAEGLSTKVEKNGVVSAINQSAESVKISAQRINLDGYATFTGLADGTTTINGNCIKTGSIDANIIKTGTLTGMTLNTNGGAFTVDSNGDLHANKATFGTGSNTFSVDSTGFKTYQNGEQKSNLNVNGLVTELVAANYMQVVVNGSSKNVIHEGNIGSSHYHGTLYAGSSSSGNSAYISTAANFVCPDNGNLGTSSNPWNNVRANNVYNSGGLITSSDERKKNTIEPLNDKYSLLFNKLNPVSYKYNNGSSGRTHLGLLAQEVEQSINDVGLTDKECAILVKDPVYSEMNDDGSYDETSEVVDYDYSIRYNELIPLCIQKIQELQYEINRLKDIE